MPLERSESDIIKQIRNALALAEGTSSESERDAALARANRLMAKHAIDQAKLDATRTAGEKRQPTHLEIIIHEDKHHEYIQYFRTIFQEIARTNRCKPVLMVGVEMKARVYGMQEDVEWVQILWTNVLFHFISTVFPKWQKDRTGGENVYHLKRAGYKWDQIWRSYFYACNGKTHNGEMEYHPSKSGYLMTWYKKYLREKDLPPVATQRFAAYRASFVQAYAHTVNMRLEEMRDQTEEAVKAEPGSEIALRDVSDLVDKLVYKDFPQLSPEGRQEAIKSAQEYARLREEADANFLASLSPEERNRVLSEREKEARERARQDERYWRKEARRNERLQDIAGFAAGQSAAKEVNLSRGGKTVEHEQRGEISG